MAKRLRNGLLAVLIAVVMICVGIAATLLVQRPAMADEWSEDTVRNIEYEPVADPVATYYLGESKAPDETNHIYYRPHTQGWAEAVKTAAEAYEAATTANKTKTYVKVILVYDWIAGESSTLKTSFGTDAAAYLSGRIYVPEGVNIVLELNGRKIDRNLVHLEEGEGGVNVDKSTPVANGHVILVQGNLTILDSSELQTGKITGGYNGGAETVYGGGVYVSKGTVNMYGGAIDGNRVDDAKATKVYGVGVAVVSGGQFNMYGGIISNHTSKIASSYGGGVHVHTSGAFNMYGGVIENNVTAYGGGVSCYNATGLPAVDAQGEPIRDDEGEQIKSVITIDGGVIRNNEAKDGANISGGGGICSYYKGNIIINSGAIHHNTTNRYGGGMCVVPASGTTDVYINGGYIHDNVAAAIDARHTYGGGIAIRRGSKSAGIFVNVDMTGGEIYNNRVIAASDKFASGGAIYSYGATFTMKGGEIYDNVACNFIQNTQDNLEDAFNGDFTNTSVLGYGNYAGGFYIYNPEFDGWADARGVLKMYGGSIRGNRANSGGGVNNQGDFEMYDGEVTGNYGKYGGIYLQEHSTVKLAGSPKIYNNYSIFDEETPANMEVASVDSRRPQIVGEFNEDANVRMFTTKELIEQGKPITQNYGKYNRMYVTFDGSNVAKYAEYDDDGNGIGEPINDGIWVYANPYRYFGSDNTFLQSGTTMDGSTVEQFLIVLSGDDAGEYEGELGVATKPITFEVTYSDQSKQTFRYGEKYDSMPLWNYVSSIYGSTVYPTTISAYIEKEGEGNEQLGSLDLTAKLDEHGRLPAGDYGLTVNSGITVGSGVTVNGKATITFYVVVQGMPLGDIDQESGDLQIEISSDENFHYSKGEEHEPEVLTITLKINGETVTLHNGTDFYVTYEDNINAGLNTAAVVINFIGNYTGTARVFFSIKSSENEDVTTSVSWEVWSEEDEDWVAYEGHEDIFSFTGSDLSKNIRAVLTAMNDETELDEIQTVYVKGYRNSADKNQNTSMSLVFYKGEYAHGQDSIEFINADTYSVHLSGTDYVNYPIDDNDRDLDGVTISPMAITLSADDLDPKKNYIDSNGTRLWSLLIGRDGTLSTTLLDSAIYVDDVFGVDNGSGVRLSNVTKTDYFARFRGTDLAVDLNRSYVLSNNMTIGELLLHSDSISDIEWCTAEMYQTNTAHVMNISFVITFNGNYTVGEDNTVTFTKEWCIVTMNNALRDADTGATITKTQLDGWTYGLWDEIKAEVFRPEHGTTVFYTYNKVDDKGNVLNMAKQFAIVYSDNTSSATRAFYGVTTDSNGKLVADMSNLLGGQYYLYTINFELEAGKYDVNITIPELEPHTTNHTHWYDEDAVANDLGVRYYELTFKYKLTVAAYELTEASFAAGGDIRVDFPADIDNWVYYNGSDNNIVDNIVITISAGKAREKVLVEGVDYELSSSNIDAGDADLTITGLNGLLNGSYTIKNAYRIVQAVNGWYDIPSIANWTYDSFDKEINLIKGEHNFGVEGLSFAISISTHVSDIIISDITLKQVNGIYVVSDEVAAKLKELNAGYYYLFAYAEETTNYSGLENQVQFRVFTATNSWVVTPTVNTWIEGRYDQAEYDEDGNLLERIIVNPVFGKDHTHVQIFDDGGTIFYDTDAEGGLYDNLNAAKPGRYFLKAWVDPDKFGEENLDPILVNYTGLDEFTLIFYVYEKPGLPWWGTLLIAVGTLLFAALIIFILWKKGVFRIVTDKILIAIRTRVSVESTIASVRAMKMMEEGKKSVEEAKRRERLERLRQKAQEQRAMSPEERAAQLAAKAEIAEAKMQAEQARIEKLRKRSEAELKKAEKIQNDEPAPETGVDADVDTDAKDEVATTQTQVNTDVADDATAPETGVETDTSDDEVATTETPETPDEPSEE